MAQISGLKKKVIKGLSWQVLAVALKFFLGIFSLSILARLIDPSDFGIYSFSLIIFSYFQIISSAGIRQSVIQSSGNDNNLYSTGFWIIFVLSAIISCLGYAITSVISILEQSKIISAIPTSGLNTLLLLLIVFNIADYFESIVAKKMKIKVVSITTFVSYLLGSVSITIALAYYGLNFYALIIGLCSTHAIRILIYSMHVRDLIKCQFQLIQAKSILKYGFGFLLAKVANLTALQIDNLVVGSALGATALGIYSKAYEMSMISIGLFTGVVDSVFFPAISLKKDEPRLLSKLFICMHTSVFSLFLLIAFILIAFDKQITLMLLGRSWIDAVQPLFILSFALPFRAGYRVSDLFARSCGYIYKRAVVQWFYAFFIFAAVLYGSNFGINGVAYSVVISIFINWIVMLVLTFSQLRLNLSDLARSSLLPIFVSLLLIFLISGWGLAGHIFDPNLSQNNYYLLLFSMSLIIMLLLLNPIRKVLSEIYHLLAISSTKQ